MGKKYLIRLCVEDDPALARSTMRIYKGSRFASRIICLSGRTESFGLPVLSGIKIKNKIHLVHILFKAT
jgi:hypothetical protein